MNANFIICVSGFTQNRGYFHGIMKLREALISNGHSEGKANRVWYVTWKDSMSRVACELSILCNQHGFKPRVMICGYSYGGWGSLQLAKELEKVGIDVEIMILCDPVGRPWWWPRPLPALTSMLGRDWAPKLRVPANVKVCHSFYQQENRPQGHQLVATNGTTMEQPIKLRHKHERMDDAPEFHGRVLKEAAMLVQPEGDVP